MGLMGSPMAVNVLKTGNPVTVWNRSPDADGVKTAAEAGCRVAPRVEDAIAQADVVFSCLTDGAALDAVFTEAVLTHLKAGALLVDCSTIGPAAAKRLAARVVTAGGRFVDAPVTGGDVGARAGTLTFMVGGAVEDVDFVKPLCLKMGKKVVHAGPVGMGQSLKLVNQLLVAENLLAVAEAFEAGAAMGLDPQLVIDGCGEGAGGSWQLNNLGPRIARKDDNPGFRVAHLHKDLSLLREELAGGGESLMCFPSVARAFAIMTTGSLQLGQRGTQSLGIHLREVRGAMD